MNTNHIRLATLLAIGLVGTAVAQEEQTPAFSEIDTDSNGQVTLIEAEQSAEVFRMFGELDADQDGQLSNEEYNDIHLDSENQ